MFCSNCGEEISTNMKYCGKCGSKVEGSSASAQDKSSDRQSILEQLRFVHTVAAQCTPHYQAFNEWQMCIEEMLCELQNPESTTWKKILYIGLPFAILLALPVLLFVGEHGWFSVALPVFMMIGGWIAICVIVKRNAKKEAEKAKIEATAEIERGRKQQQLIMGTIEQIYQDSGIASFFPQQYLYEDAVDQCYLYVETYRADSLKEAFNLYEQSLHQARLEQAQSAQYDALLDMTMEQRRTTGAATFAAIMSGITMVNSFRRK